MKCKNSRRVPVLTSISQSPKVADDNNNFFQNTHNKITIAAADPLRMGDVEISVYSVPGWNGTIDICNWGDTFYNSSTCPKAGTYTEYTMLTLPGEKDAIYSKYLLWMSMTATSMLFFFGIAAFRSRKKRNIAIAHDCESNVAITHFVVMGNNVDVSNETAER
eukprot:scaffold5678_cov267-Chaetoceros_neogracile.AAC.3